MVTNMYHMHRYLSILSVYFMYTVITSIIVSASYSEYNKLHSVM